MIKDSIIQAQAIQNGQTTLGIELGSTRIKAVLIGSDHAPIASGGFDWENRLVDGFWTYDLDEVWKGLQTCYTKLAEAVKAQVGMPLAKVGACGFSAMMHGYLAFDKKGKLLTPFRTWRNTNTEEAARTLTKLFGFNIPHRWSVAHLYQAILDKEAHVKDVAFITTLAGYVHWQLTGEKVLGIGDASGMFPIDSATQDYDRTMMAKFDALLQEQGLSYKLRDILPKVVVAGEDAGVLSAEGAARLDTSCFLQAGIPLCPPEGDAGTGMVATNSVAQRTGNVSAGTSIFAMIVLEKPLSKVYSEIDMVTTPSGKPVAMVHCNNCTSDINGWARLFCEFSETTGAACTLSQALAALFRASREGDADCGGLISYNFLSGEPIAQAEEGRPLFMRQPDSRFTFANFARTQLNAALATLRIGMNILFVNEQLRLESLLGHGGFFKTKGVGEQAMADALNVPVSVMETAGEGGSWGMALLAAYFSQKETTETLEDFLARKVFANSTCVTAAPEQDGVDGFAAFMTAYEKALPVEYAAAKWF